MRVVNDQFFALPSMRAWVVGLGTAGLIEEAKVCAILWMVSGGSSLETFPK